MSMSIGIPRWTLRRVAVASVLALSAIAARADGPAEVRRAMWLPEAVASFGATRMGDHLYVYGGHIGRHHRHSTANLSGVFARHRVDGVGAWESLPMDVPAQGVQIVAAAGRIYRVGGLVAHNASGEAERLESLASVHAFDPRTKQWHPVAPLPEGRSSHDVVVLNDALYVVGGWTLRDGAENRDGFLRSALRLDLTAAKPTWEALPTPPFSRRALVAATAFGKIFAIGGLTPEGKTSSRVDVFDPATGAWSRAPDLPGNGFGAGAIGQGDALFATTMAGVLYRLDADLAAWRPANTLALPRFFHRLVGLDHDTVLACGGTGRGGHMRSVERIRTRPGRGEAIVTHWSVDHATGDAEDLALLVASNRLWALGRCLGQGAEDSALLQIGLGTPTVRSAAAPSSRTRGARLVDVAGEVYAIGGKPEPMDASSTSTAAARAVCRFQPRERRWTPLHAKLPAPRATGAVCVHDDEVWVFGGVESTAPRTEIFRWDAEPFSPFESLPSMLPAARLRFAGAALRGRFYLVGGADANGDPIARCDVFDFENRTWSTIPGPARTRIGADLVAVGDRLYLGGGFVRVGDGAERCTTVDVYDSSTGQWSTAPWSLPIGTDHRRFVKAGDRLLAVNVTSRSIELALIDPDAPRRTITAPASGIRHP